MTRPIKLILNPALILACVMCALVTNRVVSASVNLGASSDSNAGASENFDAAAAESIEYRWNVHDQQSPLLGLPDANLKPGLDRSITYRMAQFNFPIFQSLSYDEENGRYLLPSISPESKGVHFIALEPTERKNTYASTDGSNLKLIDNDSLKTVRAGDGAIYIFVRYPDGEFRCASIKDAGGANLSMLYTANGLMLHGVVDATGRTLTFNYAKTGIESVTQTWMRNTEGLTRTWAVGDSPIAETKLVKYSHVVGLNSLKALPNNAMVRQYTAEMAASDKMLAHVFGGPSAVAGANGFEPAGLAGEYPLYRGDIAGDDGRVHRGHLSYAMHLYGSADGRGDSPLYVPAGFTSHSAQPSPTDGVVTFYYPRLGTLSDVTLAVFHVADFQITTEGARVRIGNLGGPGGGTAAYKHSHIEFYRGNAGLPALSARPGLRIDPTTVFGPQSSESAKPAIAN
jgi:hypothetical protein